MKKIVILTGAGISAESGIQTFRGAGGLWEGHDVMEVASPEGWRNNPTLVLDFYNQRRRQLKEVKPNSGHQAMFRLEKNYDVQLITQNVDDLHERAGSSKVLHLHGELFKVRSTVNENEILDWKNDLNIGDVCSQGHQLRPHIVWFGEQVPLLPKAIELTQQADIFLIVGTSLQVYPAASLLHYVSRGTPIYYIDPEPTISKLAFPNLKIIAEKGSKGMEIFRDELAHQ